MSARSHKDKSAGPTGPSFRSPHHGHGAAGSDVRVPPIPPLDLALVERNPGETRIALMAQGAPWEIHLLRDHHLMPGDILLGRVRGKAPGGVAAFVDIGADRDGFLAVEDCAPRDALGNRPPLPPDGAAVLVEVTIAARAEKGAKLTMALSIPGVLLAYTPLRPGVGLSSKISDTATRRRLSDWAEDHVHSDEGVVLRTKARDAAPEELDRALEQARKAWQALLQRAEREKPPCRLYGARQGLGGDLAAVLDGRTVDRVICAGPEAFEQAVLSRPDLAEVTTRARHGLALLAQEGVEAALEEAVEPVCGPLIIEPTAALTAIDVDSGSSTPEQVNPTAVALIAQQIRLRNLAGMILIDFAAPRRGAEAHKKALAQTLAQALRNDPARPQVLGVSSLGLVEVRRPRRGAPLKDLVAGAGAPGAALVGVSAETAGLDVLRRVVQAVGADPALMPRLRLAPLVADCLRGPLRRAVAEAEQRIGAVLPIEEVLGKGAMWTDIGNQRDQQRRL